MRRIAVLLGAAGVIALGMAGTPAMAQGWGDYGWRPHEWREHEWRVRDRMRHEFYEHRLHHWRPWYHRYGY
jgi:hypothetical protein